MGSPELFKISKVTKYFPETSLVIFLIFWYSPFLNSVGNLFNKKYKLIPLNISLSVGICKQSLF
jgi:hypothetical protein